MTSDWKVYNELIPIVRDRFLQRKNEELIAVLSQKGKSPTEMFWEAKKITDQQAAILNDCLGFHSRSKMWMSVMMMCNCGIMLDEDLQRFSAPFRQEFINRMSAKSSPATATVLKFE